FHARPSGASRPVFFGVRFCVQFLAPSYPRHGISHRPPVDYGVPAVPMWRSPAFGVRHRYGQRLRTQSEGTHLVLCPQCRFDNRASVSFCEECGARLDVLCPSCGAAVPPGRKFCGTCGKPFAAQPAPEARFTSPEVYTPKHLAERILTSKTAMEGERKQV